MSGDKSKMPNIQKLENWKELADAGPVRYWGFFSKKEIQENAGKLLMLDIDFGRECSLSCPTCFRRTNPVDDGELPDLRYDELLRVLEDAKSLGLKTVKYCGAGEPFENPQLLRFLKDLEQLQLTSAIFTKGHVLGDNEYSANIFAGHGIKNALELCERICEYSTSIMLSFHSFSAETQDQIVGKVGHTVRRNRALENLVEVGFNAMAPTRLALVCAPIVRKVKDGLLDIYAFARERNIYPVFAYFMLSGRQLTERFLGRYDLTAQEKIDLHTKIYKWNIANGLQTLEQLENEGISCMPGIHPCNQVAAGLYLTLNGNVTNCPGHSKVIGNVRKESIKDIWEKSENFRRKGIFNCRCPPKDGKTIPMPLYRQVLQKLK